MKAIGCFFCQDPDKSVIQKPQEYYMPCVACKAMMNLGVTLIGYTLTPNGHPPIATKPNAPSLYPTGNWLVLENGVTEKLLPPDIAKTMIKSGRNIVDDGFIKNIQDCVKHDYTLIQKSDIEKIRSALTKTDESGGKGNES